MGILDGLSDEIAHGLAKHGPVKSIDDGYNRLVREWHELREAVFIENADEMEAHQLGAIADEALQLAAMALRLRAHVMIEAAALG
jgi:hypothetical protein